jgi:hypothetical protein
MGVGTPSKQFPLGAQCVHMEEDSPRVIPILIQVPAQSLICLVNFSKINFLHLYIRSKSIPSSQDCEK